MADEDKSLSKILEEIVKAVEARKSDPKLQAALESVRRLKSDNPTNGAVAQIITAAAESMKQKTAAETGDVINSDAIAWLDRHWPQARRACPICASNDWGLSPQFVHLSIGPVGQLLRTRTVPCVTLTCRTCSHTIFFNAIVMGQLPKGEE